MKFKYLEVKLYKIYLDDTEAFIKAMDEDYFKEDVFEFCHPLGKKKGGKYAQQNELLVAALSERSGQPQYHKDDSRDQQ